MLRQNVTFYLHPLLYVCIYIGYWFERLNVRQATHTALFVWTSRVLFSDEPPGAELTPCYDAQICLSAPPLHIMNRMNRQHARSSSWGVRSMGEEAVTSAHAQIGFAVLIPNPTPMDCCPYIPPIIVFLPLGWLSARSTERGHHDSSPTSAGYSSRASRGPASSGTRLSVPESCW